MFIGYRTLAGEFRVTNREFSDLQCLMNTLHFDNLCGSHLQSQSELYQVS